MDLLKKIAPNVVYAIIFEEMKRLGHVEGRLRITPTPMHGDELIDQLVVALGDVWRRLALPLGQAP